MKLTDVTSESYVGDRVRISKYKKFFAKGYSQNWSEEVFVVCNIKNKVSRTYVTSDLMVRQLMELFMKNN